MRMAALLIKIPKPEGEGFEAECARFEKLLHGLRKQKGPLVFEVAVPHVGEEIHFYFAVPESLREMAVERIQSLWPTASVEETPGDFNVFNPHGVTATAVVRKKEDSLPVKTYRESASDLFEPILRAFATLSG